MAPTLRVRVRIDGAREIIQACRRLPAAANDELRDGAKRIAEGLARQIISAGRADSRQSARAARSVKVVRDRLPVISAGGTKRSSAVLFGSEFGATRHFGWYARGRYFDSVGKQFRPHRGASSFRFFKTAEREGPRIDREWHFVADDIVRRWSA